MNKLKTLAEDYNTAIKQTFIELKADLERYIREDDLNNFTVYINNYDFDSIINLIVTIQLIDKYKYS